MALGNIRLKSTEALGMHFEASANASLGIAGVKLGESKSTLTLGTR